MSKDDDICRQMYPNLYGRKSRGDNDSGGGCGCPAKHAVAPPGFDRPAVGSVWMTKKHPLARVTVLSTNPPHGHCWGVVCALPSGTQESVSARWFHDTFEPATDDPPPETAAPAPAPSPRSTQDMDKGELRKLQGQEIRAMLFLPPDVTHETVLRRLYEIGATDNRIDVTAIPRRYVNSIWCTQPTRRVFRCKHCGIVWPVYLSAGDDAPGSCNPCANATDAQSKLVKWEAFGKAYVAWARLQDSLADHAGRLGPEYVAMVAAFEAINSVIDPAPTCDATTGSFHCSKPAGHVEAGDVVHKASPPVYVTNDNRLSDTEVVETFADLFGQRNFPRFPALWETFLTRLGNRVIVLAKRGVASETDLSEALDLIDEKQWAAGEDDDQCPWCWHQVHHEIDCKGALFLRKHGRKVRVEGDPE